MNPVESKEFAKKFLENSLSFFGVNLTVEAEINDEFIELTVPTSEHNSILIGRNAETMRALQYLVSNALRGKNATINRVNLDIADYKKQRAEKIAKTAREWIEGVRQTGDSFVADLGAADRRIVHQIATEYSDIQTFSEGEGRERRLIIAQKSS